MDVYRQKNIIPLRDQVVRMYVKKETLSYLGTLFVGYLTSQQQASVSQGLRDKRG